MPRLSTSEMYAIAAVTTLLIAAALNIPALTLGVALVGSAAGLLLLRREESLTRGGYAGAPGLCRGRHLCALFPPDLKLHEAPQTSAQTQNHAGHPGII